MTHLQCSLFAWSRNQGRATKSHAADSVTFAERVQEIPSPDHRERYTGVVNTVLRYSNMLHLHQHVCHEIGDTIVRTSRFTNTMSQDTDRDSETMSTQLHREKTQHRGACVKKTVFSRQRCCDVNRSETMPQETTAHTEG